MTSPANPPKQRSTTATQVVQTRVPGVGLQTASVALSTQDRLAFAVRLEGYFKPAWMAGLCAGLADRGVSIQRVEATVQAGLWTAALELVPPASVDLYTIPYGELVQHAPVVEPGTLRLTRYRLSDSGEYGGTLRLELDAEDSLGFLGRMLSLLAMNSLFPVAMDIETKAGRAHDSFWMVGVGQASPTPQSRKQLDRMLSQSTVELTPTRTSSERFVEPAWSSALDGEAALRAVPEGSTIAGMFPEALVQAARTRKLTLPSAREHYLPFEFYAAAEHARLLLEAARLFFPDKNLRSALRTLGHSAPEALLSSTLGRVVLGAVQGPHEALQAVARTYAVNMRPSRAEVVASDATSAVIRLQDVPFFLDSHHVGVFEATMRYGGVQGRVLIAAQSPSRADLLCSWSEARPNSLPPMTPSRRA